MTPAELAAELGIEPKTLRRWLRETWPRTTPGERWESTADQAAAAHDRWRSGHDLQVTAKDAGTATPARPGAVEKLAAWSAWVPLPQVRGLAPRSSGVYMVSDGNGGPVVYVGMAGERRGQGLRGRLSYYLTGKAAVSGLGEAAMDRALADSSWVAERLAEVERGDPMRTKQWAALAMSRRDLFVRWATTDDRRTAMRLELNVIKTLGGTELWNRRR